MEDLVTFIIFLVVVGASFVNSIAQAKKRREEELEEAFQEEDREEQQEARSPAPRAEQRPPSPPSKGTGWEELRRQLEQMLGDEDVSPDTKPVVSEAKEPSRPAPIQKTEPVSLPAQPVPPKRAPVQPPRTQPRPVDAPSQRLGRKPPLAQKPVSVRQQPVRVQPQPVRVPQRAIAAVPRVTHSRRMGRFPNLHPDPLANAIVLSEILHPYSYKRGRGRRPPYGAG